MSGVFGRLAPYIQDFIYANHWEDLRDIQKEACQVVWDTDDNLLLSSGTASGKTEAAFLPVLTELYHRPSRSVGVLYISPLKALINDQFKRLDQLLQESGLPVCKWHGDASRAEKDRLVKHPQGILQITPESLESLLIRKRGACYSLFHDLRFVIIDEVHYFMRDVRGVQVLSLLERMQRLSGNVPRRIGLSATLGDIEVAKRWLNAGTPRLCSAPRGETGQQKIRLLVERFEKSSQEAGASLAEEGEASHYEYLYRMTLDKKTIVFANSREEIELVMAHLRQLALKYHTPDVYRVHHGNVSAALREHAEDEMKASEEKLVIGATVTLELGIDIGSLDQVVQIGAPATVSSFAQRLGRCGRRGQIPQLLFTFVDEVHATAADTLGAVNWEFLRIAAIVQLYTKKKWIEPLTPGAHPYSLLYHQTMSTLLSAGEISPRRLAEEVLSLAAFRQVSEEDYRLLLRHLLSIGHLERMEDSDGLIIGRAGEKVVNDYHFLAVFQVPEYYLVKEYNGNEGVSVGAAIGTVDKIYPPQTRFALAGLTWETVEVNAKAKVIFVKRVPGVSTVDWNVDFEGELHTVLVQTMRRVLAEDEAYPYLSASCRERLQEIRSVARNSGILSHRVIQLSENKFAVFPWVGTRQLYTLHFLLLQHGLKSRLLWRTCVYLEITVRSGFSHAREYIEAVIDEILASQPDLFSLPLPDKVQIEHKYNEFIPPELLRKEFILDFLDFDGLQEGMAVPR